jgi:ribonucleoside-triphosphate reductase
LNDYQTFIATSRYSRWLDNEKRRETWPEVVDRYLGFFNHLMPDDVKENLRAKITNLEVMPSMRALMTAGPALARNNVAGYNCAYLPVDSPRAFDETMFVLMCGTGVGFSVEQRNIEQLPVVNEHFESTETTINVQDSKEGWARAFRELISLLYSGQVPRWDFSRVRPAGARLKTFGGRASGPEPLESLFRFTVETFKKAGGRRLTSLECHDLMCKIGEVVVVGGVRRSAMISLSDVNDDRMRNAKTGNWWEQNGQRALANNSATYLGRPDTSVFLGEWKALYDSHSGERGLFSRDASQRKAAENGRRGIKRVKCVTETGEVIYMTKEEFDAKNIKIGDTI